MKKNKYSFDDLVENFDLSKFIKYLDKQCKNKITYPPIIQKNPQDIYRDLIKSSTTKKISYKKLEEDVVENSGDFIEGALESGNLLKYVHNNFKLEKDYSFTFEEELGIDFYFFHIISSKINKSIYIIMYYQGSTGYAVCYCIKKVKNKDLALKFIKEEHEKLSKIYR